VVAAASAALRRLDPTAQSTVESTGGAADAEGRRTCERKQLTHMLAGLASMHVPHRQHSTVARVCSTANISAASSPLPRSPQSAASE